MPYQIVRNDITQMHVDAIVNPTDPIYSGLGGTGSPAASCAGHVTACRVWSRDKQQSPKDISFPVGL